MPNCALKQRLNLHRDSWNALYQQLHFPTANLPMLHFITSIQLCEQQESQQQQQQQQQQQLLLQQLRLGMPV
ncbi:hypothetical protein AWZ03_009325 [Drosophila navojoa]|uniref:Uncharacterized protein n=1 Tax=Drosophila navojoa TaxID=7232 RepID=A0A484B864_DRONA|nr:hypothetical protein AWZ03_009325 [Drosophila navojoa]